MPGTNGSGPSLTISDMTDREILALMSDLEFEGWVEVQALAEALWPRRATGDLAAHCRRAILSRLGWISRMSGMVEKNPDAPLLYRLTEDGNLFLNARLKAAQRKAVERADDAQLADVIALIGDRYEDMREEMRWVVRREWQHRAARR